MRMIPINREVPKGLLEVKGEVLIERIIRQLHGVGIYDIYIVVGFMKEQYEYLMDKYQVELIVNPEYAVKNNLYSMKYAAGYLSNSYIIPCDIWCAKNPFGKHELYSWYMVSDSSSAESTVRVNRKLELVTLEDNQTYGNEMIGICYLEGNQTENVKSSILKMCKENRYSDAFWEVALFDQGHPRLQAKLMHSTDVMEINTYEQLRDIDDRSKHLASEAVMTIANALKAAPNDITEIEMLKKGMTNRSFLFKCGSQRYIMRIPGEGTERLINRSNETAVYQLLNNKGICDKNIYINPLNGYKITEYMENARVCDPLNQEDVAGCMKRLK